MTKIILTMVLLISFNLVTPHTRIKDFRDLNDTTLKDIKSDTLSDHYAESVHMYICIEALKLLKDRYPHTDFSQIENRIGTMNDIGTRAWQTGKITTGAYREDVEDVVFNIRGPFNFYVSTSHFWDADDRTNGDHSLTILNILGFNKSFPNAYTKICRYVDGQWFAWNDGGYHERRYIEYNPGTGLFHRYSYHTRGLINFYKTKKIWYHSYTNTLGQEVIVNEEITLDDVAFNRIIWEVLGRCLHLIQDMSVPAHAHNDVHVREWDGGDCYHKYVDDGGYTQFNWQTAKNAGGIINPYEIGNDPIRYQMYLTNQIADHYPSGPDCHEIPQQHSGDHNLPGGHYPMLLQYYQQLGPPPQNITNLYGEGNVCFNLAIRASAGFLYWFAVEIGLLSPDPGAMPVIQGFAKNLPDNSIYRGETLNLECIASGSNLNFNWSHDICDLYNWCRLPVNGLAINRNDRVFSITNVNFQNRWTCTFYDSLCNNNFNESNNSLTEDPLHFYVGVKASNQFGQDTKYYNMNNLLSFHPINGIRPPDPPITGCPVLHTRISNGFICENNVLPESPRNPGIDIVDKIVIGTKPYADTADNTIQFAVTESSHDYNHFDKFSVQKIAHPEVFSLAITNNKDIVLIDFNNVTSPKNAFISGRDVTEELKFDSAFDKGVKGEEKEIITAQYSNLNDHARDKLTHELNKVNFPVNADRFAIRDSIAIILDPSAPDASPNPYAKREAGYISVTDTAGIKSTGEINFTKRHRRSNNVLPVMSNNEVSVAELNFKEGFGLSYMAVAGIFYDGFTTTELKLTEAENSISGDIIKSLTNSDDVYAELDSSSFIILKFKETDEKLPKGWVYTYVMNIEGRSVEPVNESAVHRTLNSLSALRSENDPYKFSLKQNFPNPFNPVTNLEFGISDLGFVSLTVYDVLGNEVKTLVNEIKPAGNYAVTFDGSNLPSGIYFCKLASGTHTDVKKIILLK